MDELITKINNLILRISKGDTKALDELFLITRRMLLFMARKYLEDACFAEDVVSETYLKIVKYSSSFDSTKNGLNWIYKIVHNESVNRNSKICWNSECELDEVPDSTVYIDELLDKILIREAIDTLSDDEKYVIFLRYWKGLELREIAKIINKPQTTAYDFLKRIHKKLHKLMK